MRAGFDAVVGNAGQMAHADAAATTQVITAAQTLSAQKANVTLRVGGVLVSVKSSGEITVENDAMSVKLAVAPGAATVTTGAEQATSSNIGAVVQAVTEVIRGNADPTTAAAQLIQIAKTNNLAALTVTLSNGLTLRIENAGQKVTLVSLGTVADVNIELSVRADGVDLTGAERLMQLAKNIANAENSEDFRKAIAVLNDSQDLANNEKITLHLRGGIEVELSKEANGVMNVVVTVIDSDGKKQTSAIDLTSLKAGVRLGETLRHAVLGSLAMENAHSEFTRTVAQAGADQGKILEASRNFVVQLRMIRDEFKGAEVFSPRFIVVDEKMENFEQVRDSLTRMAQRVNAIAEAPVLHVTTSGTLEKQTLDELALGLSVEPAYVRVVTDPSRAEIMVQFGSQLMVLKGNVTDMVDMVFNAMMSSGKLSSLMAGSTANTATGTQTSGGQLTNQERHSAQQGIDDAMDQALQEDIHY